MIMVSASSNSADTEGILRSTLFTAASEDIVARFSCRRQKFGVDSTTFAARNFFCRFVTGCRAYTGFSLHDGRYQHRSFTDHNAVVAHFNLPPNRQLKSHRKKKVSSKKYDLSDLRYATDTTTNFIDALNDGLENHPISDDLNQENQKLIDALTYAMSEALPEIQKSRSKPPWEDSRLSDLLA